MLSPKAFVEDETQKRKQGTGSEASPAHSMTASLKFLFVFFNAILHTS